MITASGEQEKVAGDRGGRRRLHRQAVRPGRAARARALAAAHQALPRHDRGAGRRARGAGTASSSSASREQVDALERMGRLRRFLSPQLAELVVSSGDESFLESHRREITSSSATCAASRLRRDGRARGRDGACSRVPRRARRSRPPLRGHARALRRRRADGLLQRPARLPGRARARRADGAWRCATGSRELAEGWRRQGHDLDFGVGIAQGHATLGRIGFEGRSDYAAIGSVTNLAARLCAEAPSRGRSSSASASTRRSRTIVVADARRRAGSCAASRARVRAYNVVGLDEARARA